MMVCVFAAKDVTGDGVLQLERSIVELAQLFQDMAILVESQGELINSIDNNVSMAKVCVWVCVGVCLCVSVCLCV